MYEHILVATDGSAPATRAETHALTLCERTGADLHAVHIVDAALLDEPALDSAEIEADELEAWGRRELEAIADRAGSLGVGVTTRCLRGEPHVEILDYAAAIDADVVLVGHQGNSHSRPGPLGSVSDRVVANAERPVFVA